MTDAELLAAICKLVDAYCELRDLDSIQPVDAIDSLETCFGKKVLMLFRENKP